LDFLKGLTGLANLNRVAHPEQHRPESTYHPGLNWPKAMPTANAMPPVRTRSRLLSPDRSHQRPWSRRPQSRPHMHPPTVSPPPLSNTVPRRCKVILHFSTPHRAVLLLCPSRHSTIPTSTTVASCLRRHRSGHAKPLTSPTPSHHCGQAKEVPVSPTPCVVGPLPAPLGPPRCQPLWRMVAGPFFVGPTQMWPG
jgi:hypothetical protein